MRAAVANGANAVYFGLQGFNARARAANFTLAELPQVLDYLHRHQVLGFVAMNILIFPGELPEAERTIRAMADAGVDAVIVQDLGLVRLIRAVAPTLPVHASTQMTLTEPRGIELVRSLGLSRVVLARELSLPEIEKVARGTTTPLEVFVHGALCVAYSGQCLTSEALGGRSANRGQCAQACRLPYELIVDGQPRDLGDRAYLLSPQDLAAYERIEPLIRAGVISFKIEGRLKGGPYVAATTATYRKAIDAAAAGQTATWSRTEALDLAQTFSRGLTTGFLDGVNHQKLVRGRFPKSRGVRLGTVVRIRQGRVTVRLAESLPVAELVRAGDGLLFDLGRPETIEPGGRVWEVLAAPQTGEAELRFAPQSLDLSLVPIGCEVYKTDDPALTKRLRATYQQDRIVHRWPIAANLSATPAGGLTLTLQTLGEGAAYQAEAHWPGPLPTAHTHPTPPDSLREAIARLGDTPYVLDQFDHELPPQALVPKSVVNELRRQAVARLEAQRTASDHHPTTTASVASLRATLPTRAAVPAQSQLIVLVRSEAQLEALLAWKPLAGLRRPLLIADFEDLRRYSGAVSRARASQVTLALATNRIWKPGEDGFQAIVARAQPDAVLIRNLGSIRYFQEACPQAELWGDFSLNVANELTADWLLQQGLCRLTPSYDLNWQQFQDLCQQADPGWFAPVIHQHMPMFHMEHCVFAAFLSQGKDHTDCGRPCERHTIELRDRVGAAFRCIPTQAAAIPCSTACRSPRRSIFPACRIWACANSGSISCAKPPRTRCSSWSIMPASC